MKKTLILAPCLLFVAPVFSQSKAHHTTAHKTYHQSATISPEKSKMLCKPWVLDSVEQFGVAQKASPKEKSDAVTFVADGTFFITSEGVASTGKWTGTANPYIYTTTGTPEEKKMYKLISLSNNKLVLEYQTPDLIRIHYTYSPKQ